MEENPIAATHVRDTGLAEALDVRSEAPYFVLDRQGRVLLRDVFRSELPKVIKGLLDGRAAPR